MRSLPAAFLIAAMIAAPAWAAPRLAAIPPSAYDAEQAKAAAAFEAARGKPPFGPFAPMMASPKLMSAARATGDYLRFDSAIGTTLSELVILIVSRAWSQDYEWSLHAPIAARQGIAQSVVDAIADGRRPEAMTSDEAICYDFTIELLHDKRVSDATFDRAEQRFGDKGVVDLTGLSGYYTLLAMQLNVARVPPEPGGPVLRHWPD